MVLLSITPIYKQSISVESLVYENVVEYYGYSPWKRDASVGLHTVLAEYSTFDSTRDRYESIQTVIKPTQKKEGQLGGQSLLRW